MNFLQKLKYFSLTFTSPCWKSILILQNIEIGKNFITIGKPGINKKRNTLIKIGEGVTLCNTERANPLAEMGRCRLATVAKGAKLVIHNDVAMSSTVICCAQHIEIGARTILGGGVTILDTDFHPRSDSGKLHTDPRLVSLPVFIGEDCFIGMKTIILKGVTIGDRVTIGAGSVVTKDIPSDAFAVGNPVRIIHHNGK